MSAVPVWKIVPLFICLAVLTLACSDTVSPPSPDSGRDHGGRDHSSGDLTRCFSDADCDDQNPCTDDACDGTGACANVHNNAPCDDQIFCNGADSCSGGACAVHAGDPCLDGPECVDRCDEASGTCLLPVGSPCAKDQDDCTRDICDGAGGCTHPDSSLCVGLISWWRFDEGTGSDAADSMGPNQGQLWPAITADTDGPAWRADQDCVAGGCLLFDGGDDAVVCGEDHFEKSAWICLRW